MYNSVLQRLIAATAMHHDAVVLHYDADYDQIARAYPSFNGRWIVRRGSVD